MFDFAETTKEMTAMEILNYYRNLYYAEPQVTERGIVANAINDVIADVAPKSEVDRLELTLQGVMWSVDKWLDEADYDADPVKRAITMREKTLQIVENAENEVETLKDSNEHLAVMLEEAKDEANRYKRYYFHHDYDKMIDEGKADVARGIFEDIYEDCFDQYGYINYEALAELKKKYKIEE